jgi:Mn2+/Fe2+ NRAMP family transporter
MAPETPAPAPIPRSFAEYLRAMGPGIVVALTWLGAGDIVDSAVAGGSYGYALMWVLVLALAIRWLFVSTIARYQLCNSRSESLMQGLRRLHPAFPPFILAACVVFAHIINAYMYQGLGESCAALAGVGAPWVWAVGWSAAFALVVFRPSSRQVETVFLLFLGLLSVCLIGAAAATGPDFAAILKGTLGFQLPERRGDFHPELVAVSLVGAVAGSLANLMYPYFIRQKGWTTPAHRRVQMYDLAFGVLMIVILDLAVWALGAEVLHPRGATVGNTGDLARLLSDVIGPIGGTLIYLGVFAAVGSSIVGNALAYGAMATDAHVTWKQGDPAADPRRHPTYRLLALWALFSPLVWVLSGRTSFVALTIAVNAFQVLLLPILALAVWALTARESIMGAYRNRPWENAALALFLAMALLGAYGGATSLWRSLTGG